jgi:predicted DNA-binding WGR domain protein
MPGHLARLIHFIRNPASPPAPLHFPLVLPPRQPQPVQLPLFDETASLVRIRPEHREWRYYRMEIWPDLFGRALLVRQWGRIGTQGRRRLDPRQTAQGISGSGGVTTRPAAATKKAAGRRPAPRQVVARPGPGITKDPSPPLSKVRFHFRCRRCARPGLSNAS